MREFMTFGRSIEERRPIRAIAHVLVGDDGIRFFTPADDHCLGHSGHQGRDKRNQAGPQQSQEPSVTQTSQTQPSMDWLNEFCWLARPLTVKELLLDHITDEHSQLAPLTRFHSPFAWRSNRIWTCPDS